MTRKYDITIISDGIQSEILYYQLRLKGLNNILIISERNPVQSIDLKSACYKEPKDHITRYSHSFGHKVARHYYETAAHAFSLWEVFCKKEKALVRSGDLLRISQSAAEDIEMTKAVSLLRGFAIPVELDKNNEHSLIKNPNAAMTFEIPAIRAALMKDSSGAEIELSKISSIEVNSHGCKISLASNEIIETEFVIAANGHHLAKSFPLAQKTILPQPDQLTTCSVDSITDHPIYAFTQFNLIEGYQSSNETWSFNGARYLRGERQRTHKFNPKIEKHCLEKWKESDQGKSPLLSKNKALILDTVVCDERPVFGPWPGFERLLISIPAHCSEIPMAFLFAAELANIISTGRVSQIADPYLARRFQL